MSNTINSTPDSLAVSMSQIDLGPHNSIQFMFAQLQLAQAEICKGQAEAYIDKIKETQEKQKECAEMIEMARELQNKAENGEGDCSWDKNASVMPQEMKEYFDANGLKYDSDGNDLVHNKDEWEFNIKSLTNYQETLGTSTQTDMVYLQDFMSQYNGFLQGANSAIQDSNDTLTTILRG